MFLLMSIFNAYTLEAILNVLNIKRRIVKTDHF